MNGREKSDRCVVPKKLSNKERRAPRSAETVEGRDLAKGNSEQQNRFRTQCRADLQRELNRVREAAKRDKKMRFTALWHHVYNVDRLREAYFGLKRSSAPGVDGQTWQQYGEHLEVNLRGLADRLKAGTYRAKPVRRVYIPKPDGRQRPIGVYGFRPGRSQHNALDALTVGLERKRVNWVLDADIRGFYDAIDHDWLVKFIEHRIADQRVVRHVKKWLNAGVLEEGKRTRSKEGTPQGGSASPLLAMSTSTTCLINGPTNGEVGAEGTLVTLATFRLT